MSYNGCNSRRNSNRKESRVETRVETRCKSKCDSEREQPNDRCESGCESRCERSCESKCEKEGCGGVRLAIVYEDTGRKLGPTLEEHVIITGAVPTEFSFSNTNINLILGIISSRYSYKAFESSNIYKPLIGRLYQRGMITGVNDNYSIFVGNVIIYIGQASDGNGISVYIQSTGADITLAEPGTIVFIANDVDSQCRTIVRKDPCIFFDYSIFAATSGNLNIPILALPLDSISTTTNTPFIPDLLFTEADIPYLSDANGCKKLVFKVYSLSPFDFSDGLFSSTGNNSRDANFIGSVILSVSGTGDALRLTAFSTTSHPVLIPAGSLFVSESCCEIEVNFAYPLKS